MRSTVLSKGITTTPEASDLLLPALLERSGAKGQTLQEMSADLGVTYGFVNQLRAGHRKIDDVSDSFVAACARYLGVPYLSALMLAGRLKPEHAYESEDLLAKSVPRAMKFICDDPQWGPLATAQVRALAPASQFMLIRLYEQATGRNLLPPRVDMLRLADEVAKMSKAKAAPRKASLNKSNQRKAASAA